MKHLLWLCTFVAALAYPIASFSPAFADDQKIEDPCEGTNGVLARACEEARDLLMKGTDIPDAEERVWAIRTAKGWHYRYGNDRDETTCADPGPLMLPRYKRIELVSTSHDAGYIWSVAALGLDLTLLPGRMETSLIKIQNVGHFAGDISNLSGARIKGVDGSVRVVEPPEFASWLVDVKARSC